MNDTYPKDTYKLPRLHCDLQALSPSQAHYLKNVMRLDAGAYIRGFDGVEGEWLLEITALSKKVGLLNKVEQLKAQPAPARQITVLFTPIKKARNDFLIEKAVEMGADVIQPVFTALGQKNRVNEDRLQAQIIEAAEQCERLTLPRLAPALPLPHALKAHEAHPLLAALERLDGLPYIKAAAIELNGQDCAILIGPEGGFTAEEKTLIRTHSNVRPVNLGERTLRAETALMVMLAHL